MSKPTGGVPIPSILQSSSKSHASRQRGPFHPPQPVRVDEGDSKLSATPIAPAPSMPALSDLGLLPPPLTASQIQHILARGPPIALPPPVPSLASLSALKVRRVSRMKRPTDLAHAHRRRA